MSRGLGQGELLTPPPPRKLIVPEGHLSHWGVDCSTKAVSVASVSADGLRGVSTRAFPKRSGGERLAEIMVVAHNLAMEMCEAGLAPGVIAVEQPAAPKSRPVNPPMYYAVGVIVSGLMNGTRWWTQRLPAMEWVMPSQWKALACGSGAIKKPDPKTGEPYPVLQWARTVGYLGSDWNECDAFGIAEWARRTFALEQR